MTAQPKHVKKKPLPTWLPTLLTLGVIALGVLLAWRLLPSETFDTDLTLIGQGQPLAVLIHETGSPNSIHAMDLMNQIRHEVQLKFLVASLGHPEGQAFAREHQAEAAGLMVFFDAQGQRTDVVFVQSLADINRGLNSLRQP